ncbi:bifunctional folylpolyglutamate synthase/dihydrofolate synthase [Rothia nasimurium]|uniref:bifunctional folylpolyglutamate synthase/dihydrofolate synthase n=1 Tax=Rothia nasimurium TaxID=85336 RepID=UPI001EFF28C3|nr:Mur ligase family protein [Rothia nasimurium]
MTKDNMELDPVFAEIAAEGARADDALGVASVYADLLARAPEHKMAPRLDAMTRAVEILGEPNKAAPVIHITGTNGKTSTARMIERLLMAHDIRVGRYTSPHISKVTERISIDGAPVADSTFVRIWGEIQPYLQIVDAELEAAGAPRITYFEALTILAFAIFADEPVDVMVLEVGIGGSWDATNVADATVSVVTPIGLDHTDMLGETLAEIAGEKAGIIKDGGFLISAAQDPSAAQVLLEAARAHNADYRFEGVEFGAVDRTAGVGGQLLTIQGLAGRYEDIALPLFGAHQAQNAAVALAAVEAFLGGGEKELSLDLIKLAFGEVRSPGRLEVARTEPPVVLDAAHNPHGVAASAAAFKESFSFEELHLVVGILGEKDAATMLNLLFDEYVDRAEWRTVLHLTKSDSPRAIAPEELAELALDAGFDEDTIETYENIPDALSAAVTAAADVPNLNSAVLVTGSITVVGEASTLLGL